MSDLEQKVREMAKLSILSDRISEFHEKNMSAYPRIFFNGVKEAKLEYVLKRGEPNYVRYELSLEENADNPVIEKRFDTLSKSIKNLFWKEVVTYVSINGKEVYVSDRRDDV